MNVNDNWIDVDDTDYIINDDGNQNEEDVGVDNLETIN